VNYIFKGTNGSMGLVTGNKYGIILTDIDGEKVMARILLTSEPVYLNPHELLPSPVPVAYIPSINCPYDSPEAFKNNWRVADECRCTNPGEDDGSTTCWVHHNCMTGDCTHNE